jgi:hypothetical protein
MDGLSLQAHEASSTNDIKVPISPIRPTRHYRPSNPLLGERRRNDNEYSDPEMAIRKDQWIRNNKSAKSSPWSSEAVDPSLFPTCHIFGTLESNIQ